MTSYTAAAIVDTSPHPPSDISASATSNGKSKRSEFLVLKGSSATNGATKFLKPKRNRKKKEYTRKLQASPQLLDIVVGNFDFAKGFSKGGAINQLLVNNGAGGYDEADVEDLPGGTLDTGSIVVADVNEDGFDDIIVGNVGNNQLLLNNGNNTFTVGTLPGGTSFTLSIATADVNNDGFDDIIVGNGGGGQANQLLINNGAGTFTVETLPGGTLDTASIATADVNNDGFEDIIVGNFFSQANQVLINNGDGTFTASDLPGGDLDTRSIATADVNNDGFEDIIVGNSLVLDDIIVGQANQVLINNGDNTFTALDLPGGDLVTTSITTADVDDDGDIDIIVGNSVQANQLLINNGNGAFTVSDLPGGDLSTFSIATADVDDDGFDDILVGNDSGQANQVLINNGAGTFTNETLPGGALSTASIAVIRTAPAPPAPAPASTSEYTILYDGILIG